MARPSHSPEARKAYRIKQQASGFCAKHPKERLQLGKKQCERCHRYRCRLYATDADGQRSRATQYHLKAAYGLTLEAYAAMSAAQNGLCAICRNPPGKQRFHVDHDHATGKVRALLCYSCNVMLGYARDRIDTLKAAIAYLELHRAR